MSFSKSITFETGSNGDAATTTNVQADSLSQTASAGTMQISTTLAHSGTRSLHCTGTSTNGVYCAIDSLGGLSNFTFDFWIRFATLPSAEATFGRLLDSGLATQCSLAVNGLGALVLRNAAGTSVFASASGKRLTTGAWFHVIWNCVYGTSGSQQVQLFNAAGTLVDDSTVLTSNNGANMFDSFRRGPKAATTTATSDFYLDDVSLTGAGGPTASFTTSLTGLTLSVDGTGSTAVSPATISGYDWDWGDGTTHGTGSTATHTYTAAGSYTVVLTVTDSNSATGSANQSVTIAAPAGTVTAQSVTVSTGWTPSTGTALTCITDADSTTLVSSQSPPTAQEFDVVLQPLTAPSAGQPLKVFVTMDATLATSGTADAQLFEGATQRSSVTGVAITPGSGSSVSSIVTLTFPWTDVQNITTGGWNALTVKLQVTAS